MILIFTSRDKRLFAAARAAAHESDFKTKVGCVITLKSNILATGKSSNKTSPMQKRYNRYRHFANDKHTEHKLHSEIQALQKIKFLDVDRKKLSIYTYREFKDGSYALARPCPGCIAALKEFGIYNIYYTTNGGLAYEDIS